MTVRVKLRTTLVGQLGGDDLAETVNADTLQRTIAPEHELRETDVLPEVGEVIDRTYRLVDKLGEGMFGRVYVAERTDVPEHRVALKVINRVVYAGRNPERELVMLAAATHPNIVELKDHGVTADYVWLTMPLYDGETLAGRLVRGTLGLREAYEIFHPVARGVQALHARGLRHQDIKPENIYLANFAGQLHPVLLDLGVAVEKDAPFVAGTALFGAPEQVAALGSMGDPTPLSEKMDTYCLASTLLYALVGEAHFPGVAARTPFDIANAFEVRANEPLAEAAMPELTGKPRELLIAAFARWLVMDPELRSSTGELAETLDVLLEKERDEERAVQRRVARQKTALGRFRLATAAVLVVILGIGFYLFWDRKNLQLARELQEARRTGRSNFEELEGCKAAYDVENNQHQACADGRRQEGEEHTRTFAALKADSERETTTLNEQLTSTNTKLKICDDDKVALDETFSSEKVAWEEQKSKLQSERDELDKARTTCEANVTTANGERDQCKKDLASCMSDDIYATPSASPAPGPGPTQPATKQPGGEPEPYPPP